VGSTVNGTVVSYSSHGAYVAIGDVFGYVPMRLMSDPPPRSAREMIGMSDAVSLVVAGFNPGRRGIDLALPGMVPASGEPVGPVKATGARRGAKRPAKKEPVAKKVVAKAVAKAPVKAAAPAKKAVAKAPVKAAAPAKKAVAKAPAKKAPVKAAAPAKKAAAKAPAKKAAAPRGARR